MQEFTLMTAPEGGWLVQEEFRMPPRAALLRHCAPQDRPTIVVWQRTQEPARLPLTGPLRLKRLRNFINSPRTHHSTHFTILRDGVVVQHAEIGKHFTLHSGASQYEGKPEWSGLGNRPTVNKFSVGVALDNAGARHPDKAQMVQVFEGGRLCTVEPYTEEQLSAARALAVRLARFFGKLTHVGHDQIALTDPNGPGVLFDLEALNQVQP